MLSDGSLRFICLTTLLLQPVWLLPDTILINEPELGLHPYAIAVLVDMFKQVAEDKQLIVSTESVELVNGTVTGRRDRRGPGRRRLDIRALHRW
jgi:predicted ATPase